MRTNKTNQIEWTYDSNREQAEALWPSLGFSNDYIFGAVLKSNPDLCRRLLECVLDIPIRKVVIVTPQRESSPSLQAKSVRLDAYVGDDSGRVFDVEMQRYEARHLVKRARYYQAVMDTEQLDKGTDYQDLPDAFVIFFCTFDPFGRGLKRYTYRQACKEDGSFAPWDGSERVYLNTTGTRGDISDDLQSVLDYIAGHNNTENALVSDIEHAVTDVLSSEERRREFVDMQLRMQDEHRLGHEEGFAIGHAEGLEQGLEKGLEQGLEQGRADTLALLSRLSQALAEANRSDELPKALADSDYLDALCKEFGIK